jgi:hypothetical protein
VLLFCCVALRAVLLCAQPDSKRLQRVLDEAQPQIEQLLAAKEPPA